MSNKPMIEQRWKWSYVLQGNSRSKRTSWGQFFIWPEAFTVIDLLVGYCQGMEVAHDPELGSNDKSAEAICQHIVDLHNASLSDVTA